MRRQHLISTIVVILFVTLAVGTSRKKKEGERGNPIEIAADKLTDEFKGDPDAANTKYKGQWLRITGTVEKIDKEKSVTLKSKEAELRIRCEVKGDDLKKLADVKEGSKVTIRGQCDGKDDQIVLKDCWIIESKP